MSTRTYGQYCGLAYALELVGERWALLVVRDLIPGPKRFTDLRRGLPRIPSNVLSARLKELEGGGSGGRRCRPPPGRRQRASSGRATSSASARSSSTRASTKEPSRSPRDRSPTPT